MLVFGWNFSWCLVEILKIKCDVICVWTCDMTSRSYFGKMNSTLGSVVPLAMFVIRVNRNITHINCISCSHANICTRMSSEKCSYIWAIQHIYIYVHTHRLSYESIKEITHINCINPLPHKQSNTRTCMSRKKGTHRHKHGDLKVSKK